MSDNGHLPKWLQTNAWREIFTRIFAGVEARVNVSPDWLVNPATNRRLKLDILYPTLGVAVRFEGLQGKNRRQRPSLEEEAQQHTRENARATMCEAHGIALIVVDTTDPEPKTIFRQIDVQLSRAGQRLEETILREIIREGRATASAISRRITSIADLKLYADLWQDRQYQIPKPESAPDVSQHAIRFTKGMDVEHAAFGPGVVLTTNSSNGDTLITVDFVTAGQKTLVASLVGDKLWRRKS